MSHTDRKVSGQPGQVAATPFPEAPKLKAPKQPARSGSLMCCGLYEAETTINGVEQTVKLSGYAKHTYKATRLEDGRWAFTFRQAKAIGLVVETPGVKAADFSKEKLQTLQSVIADDLGRQFKVNLAKQFAEAGVGVPRGLQGHPGEGAPAQEGKAHDTA